MATTNTVGGTPHQHLTSASASSTELVQQAKNVVQLLEDRLKDSELSVRNQKTQLDAKAADIRDLTKSLDDKDTETSKYRSLAGQKERAVESVKKEKERLISNKQQMQEKCKRLEDLNNKFKEDSGTNTTLKTQVKELQTQTEELLDDAQKLTQRFDELRKTLEQAQREHDNATKTLQDEHEQTAEQAQQALKHKHTELEAERTAHADLTKNHANAVQELDDKVTALADLDTRYKTCTDKNAELEEELEAERKVSAGLRVTVTSLEREKDELKTTVKRLEQNAEAATELLVRQRAEQDDLRNRQQAEQNNILKGIPRTTRDDGDSTTDAVGTVRRLHPATNNIDNRLPSPTVPSMRTPPLDVEQSARSTASTESAVQRRPSALAPSSPAPYSPSSRGPQPQYGGRAGQLAGTKRPYEHDAQASKNTHWLNETCFFWYHDNCNRINCPYKHALTDPPSVVHPPPNYQHPRSCGLEWCAAERSASKRPRYSSA